jgi:hypothetical protein
MIKPSLVAAYSSEQRWNETRQRKADQKINCPVATYSSEQRWNETRQRKTAERPSPRIAPQERAQSRAAISD